MLVRVLGQALGPSQRWSAWLAAMAVAACGDGGEQDKPRDLTGIKVVREDKGDRPLAGLPSDWQMKFNAGDVLFDQTYFDAQGLGPVFIRAACGSCHADDGRGPGAVRKMVLVGDDGAPLSDQSKLTYGHTIRPQTKTGVTQAVTAPDDTSGMLITVRMPPAVFGRGYLEAIDDAEIQRMADEQAAPESEVSGRINWVIYASEPNPDTRFHAHQPGERLIGRFGLKARIATLDDFTADALQGDMGLTSDLRPDELPSPAGEDDDLPGIDVAPDTVNRLADYMRLLRIPARPSAEDDRDGAALFAAARCSDCHVPTLHTAADYAYEPLADMDAPIYTDMLLHDMGPDFADGLSDFDAGSREWRTAPLIGMRFIKNYLHDGRASTVEQAIELHGAEGSEAAAAVQRFRDLDEASRQQLLDFVTAL